MLAAAIETEYDVNERTDLSEKVDAVEKAKIRDAPPTSRENIPATSESHRLISWVLCRQEHNVMAVMWRVGYAPFKKVPTRFWL